MNKIGVIGGTGIYQLPELESLRREVVHTPYGEPSGFFYHRADFMKLKWYFWHGMVPRILFLRTRSITGANIWALKNLGVTHIVAFAAVGGIRADMGPEKIVIPDQIVDYTYGRKHTFFEDDLENVTHIDFTWPYDAALRKTLIRAAEKAQIAVVDGGTYGATQGPRLETAAEINRLERDGSDLVGMTGMPEAALAREQDLPYATVAVVANWAAGRSDQEITLEDIYRHLQVGMDKGRKLLTTFLQIFDQ